MDEVLIHTQYHQVQKFKLRLSEIYNPNHRCNLIHSLHQCLLSIHYISGTMISFKKKKSSSKVNLGGTPGLGLWDNDKQDF